MNPAGKIPHSLSILMPVYNEQEVIESVVKDYLKIADAFTQAQLILVNDASRDMTGEVLAKLAAEDARIHVLTNETNMGHGRSLMRAYRAAQGDYVFHVDSDNQFAADDFWKLYQAAVLDDSALVIGYRKQRHDPFARLILTRCLKVSLSVLFRVWFPDANSPFRLYTKEALNRILPLVEDSALLPSICLAIAAYKRGCKLTWVEVRHLPRVSGHTFIRSFKIFRLVFVSLSELTRFRRRLTQAN